MTEKQYGGATGRGTDKIVKSAHKTLSSSSRDIKAKGPSDKRAASDNSSDNENYIKAGKIAKQAVAYAKTLIKKDTPLLEIADKVEAKIIELGGKPAFPVNLSINEIAAHYTPSYNDTTKASGLLKTDIGVHIDGCIADTAFSTDLDGSEENKKLITAAEKALLEACKTIKPGIRVGEIGAAISKTIKSTGFTPINNLSGHSLAPYFLHSGITIPNTDNSAAKEIEEGAYAIEPFATTGFGSVRDGKLSGIFRVEKNGNVRDTFAREVLAFISEEYSTLPFCSRWIFKKFGARGLLALRRIEEAGIVHHYPQLIEIDGKKVSQAEHTVLLDKDKKTITTI